ncbi:maltokinase N-terminal cap-like domain-containing protein [Bailinhaonella thermotolerans]|uniref:Maltokinase n=1 Tax=Bailinhaonella thermotolerans TaxID=1070861 RepID=A0A3A4AAK7_9ACTN|nr:phosphotransferase [Bailinhaonella thermotolerans]RJL25119.1 aminoglycoside phosphotransferase [Bailinhaonella thermotolerans]
MTTSLQALLAGWISGQRWFAGKGRAIDELTVISDIELTDDDPGMRHLVLAVRQGENVDHYQLLVGLRAELPDRLRHVEIGPVEFAGRTAVAYDGLHDTALTRLLLRAMSGGEDFGGLRFRGDAGLRTDLRSLVVTAEQSNTSLVFGDIYILKLFRRLNAGLNPELEIVSALAERGSPHVARPYGHIELEGTTCAILQEFLAGASDGWSLATTSVRDFYASPEGLGAADVGGDFAAEAERLGAATAEVHQELAAAFPTGELDRDDLVLLATGMHKRLEHALSEVAEMAPYAEGIMRVFDALAMLGRAETVQRVHGDYHLGQVMRTTDRWVVLDFEGEPGQPLAERRALSSPLRDVAGMLRSFEYAARHLLVPEAGAAEPAAGSDQALEEARAAEWAAHNRAAFMNGYATGGTDPRDHAVLLRALELDKAVYEVLYEARNRPSWLRIPLGSLEEYRQP